LSSSTFSLELYGWDPTWASAFSALNLPEPLLPGRVVRVDRGQCELVTAGGPLRAETRHRDDVCTGDWVAVTQSSVTQSSVAQSSVAAVLPRRSALIRAVASGRSRGQVLAANVDVVAVVVSCAVEPDLGRVERLLALAWESGAQPLIVLTKADACPDASFVQADVAGVALGVDTVLTSATTGEGLAELGAALTGTVVLVGQSGVGKSTLATALTGVELAVEDVRDQDGKGRHTTVRRELAPLASGAGVLIDTPGLRGVGLWDAEEGLSLAFADIDELAAGCRFDDCAHHTEPGCAVLAAIEAGTLPARRLESYRKLARENEWAAARTDARLRAERTNRYKIQAKAARQAHPRPGDRRPDTGWPGFVGGRG
jgi:ribosome biogenesis GTPase